jgi:YD repeat-containing protein
MKNFWQMAIVAILMLTACSFGTKAAENKDDEKEKVEDNAGYAHAYGLYGNVKEVRISICKMTDLADGEEPWVESDKLEMAFDRQGRITIDSKGNTYKYDEAGNVSMMLRGDTPVNEIKLDSKGRIVRDSKRDGLNDREFEDYTFTYDAQGRLLTSEANFWEALDYDSLVYEGNKVYPAKIITNGAAEADNYENTTEYDYRGFDDHGNWTECYATTNGYEMIADDESTREKTHYEQLERRKIIYYSDDEININNNSKKDKNKKK